MLLSKLLSRRNVSALHSVAEAKSRPFVRPPWLLPLGLTVLGGSIVRLVYGNAEALVAAPPTHHVGPWSVKGHLGLDALLLGLGHSRLQALQGT